MDNGVDARLVVRDVHACAVIRVFVILSKILAVVDVHTFAPSINSTGKQNYIRNTEANAHDKLLSPRWKPLRIVAPAQDDCDDSCKHEADPPSQHPWNVECVNDRCAQVAHLIVVIADEGLVAGVSFRVRSQALVRVDGVPAGQDVDCKPKCDDVGPVPVALALIFCGCLSEDGGAHIL